MDKENTVHRYTVEYYSAIKKNDITPFRAKRMDLEIIILTEESERERQIPYDATYIWDLKSDANELIYKTETYSQTPENRLEEGWTGSLGLADANYLYIRSDQLLSRV